MESIHSAGELLHLARAVLEDAGAPPATAAAVAESLVESNLRGHDSHGVRRLVPYLEFVRDGQVDPTAEPEVTKRRGAVGDRRRPWRLRPGGRTPGGRGADRPCARARRRRRGDPARQPRRPARRVGRTARRRGPDRARLLQRRADGGPVRRARAPARHQPAGLGRPAPPPKAAAGHGLVDRHDAGGQAGRRPRPRRAGARRRARERRGRAVARPGRLLRRRRAAAAGRAQGIGAERDDPARRRRAGGDGRRSASRATRRTGRC